MIDLTAKSLLVEVARLDENSEDGFSLSRRSVLTEKLLPATRTPVARRRGPRVQREREPFEGLPV